VSKPVNGLERTVSSAFSQTPAVIVFRICQASSIYIGAAIRRDGDGCCVQTMLLRSGAALTCRVLV
jgi:hypothetical protein